MNISLFPRKDHGDNDVVSFHRRELALILSTYGRMVAAGHWRDYAIDHRPDVAIFSIFRHSAENPLYSIEKRPKLAARQGAYAIFGANGQTLKRGRDLAQTLTFFDRKNLKVID